ncbi:MAG TPA: hypothetical protein VFS36_03555 [Chitinophagaceae bacterium]|jgi:hypothetical protein|nr:hypothetical protein [Chitinophagaceae bacterium]
MLERLIEITNSEDFIQDGHIAVKEVIARQREYDLRLIFDIQYSVEEITKFHCEIYCEGIAYTTSNRLHEYKRPYNRINLYRDHPVLWNYGSSHFLTLKGVGVNIAELLGDLFLVHDKACGNWVDFHWLFNTVPNRLDTAEGAIIEIPTKLLESYVPIFDKHKLTFTVIETTDVKNEYSVLLFGNPDISPDNYNFGHPYIVAEKFTETLNAANTSIGVMSAD